ncbi:hypothetical protein V1477_009231 [Vespula maculifrons]|uniref:Uncharacterized protein n=1 Tax=Vespula maculifrons TaxID=7453 RepID=A0ABD2CCU8_VESMC
MRCGHPSLSRPTCPQPGSCMCLTGWLVGCLLEWLVGWLVGCLVAWLLVLSAQSPFLDKTDDPDDPDPSRQAGAFLGPDSWKSEVLCDSAYLDRLKKKEKKTSI